MEKCFNQLNEAKQLLVTLPLLKNEVDLGSLHLWCGGLCENSLRLLFLDCCRWGFRLRCCRGTYSLGREVGITFFIVISIFVCICVCFNNDSLNKWFMELLFLLLLLNVFFGIDVKFLKAKKIITKKEN